MPVIGLKFDSMESKRNKSAAGLDVKVNSTPKILDAKEITVPTLEKKALSLTFEFKTVYEPDVGEIKIEGELLFLAEKNAEILKQWKKNKNLIVLIR